MALVGILGDAHGKFDVILNIIKSNPHVKRWFQIGDLGGESMEYPEFPSNFHFIQGNHENWDYLARLKEEHDPSFLVNGTFNSYDTADISYIVGVLGGNYSPLNYNNQTTSLVGRKRRFFTVDDYDSLIYNHIRLNNRMKVDILLTHEAPTPFKKSIVDIGIPIVTDVLKKIKPDIHFFGHHHIYKIIDHGECLSVGLEYADKSYILYNLEERRFKKVDL